MPCPDFLELEQFASGDLDGAGSDSIEVHVGECNRCRALLDDISENLRMAGPLRSAVIGRVAVTAIAAPQPTIDGFEILGEIGRGGMGIVYEAQQRHPPRNVAIKVLNMVRAFDGHSARMMEREAAILARLRHPNIATVHQAGMTRDGRSFLAMELVRGLPLIQFANEQGLSLRARIELFVKVCDAIAAAHQRGIIHRDLKASNILVETDGTPRVLDFGLAKLVEASDASGQPQSMLSEIGRVVGTIPYMSPEQARGDVHDIDVRSDVYSLGVSLYELTTGKPPYQLDPARLHDAVRIINEQSPQRPSHSSSQVRGDLETIILKALEKEPQRRYDSAAALRDDLQRYLANQPILARPPTLRYQVRKLIARHRVPAALIAALAVLIIAFGVSAAVMAVRLDDQRRAAENATEDARKQASIAQAVNTFLTEMLASANPEQGGLARNIRVVDVIAAAADDVGRSFAAQPEVEAAIRFTIGNTYRALGDSAAAEEHLRAAAQIQRRLDADSEVELSQTLNKLARLLEDQRGRYADAEIMFREALEIRQKRLGPDHAEAVVILNNLGLLLHKMGRAADAEAMLRDVLEKRRITPGENSSEFATALNNLALVVRARGDVEGALAMFQQSLTIDRAALGDDHPNVVTTTASIAAVLSELNRHDEAERLLRECIDRWREMLGPQHPTVGRGLSNLADVHRRRGDLEGAEGCYREALELYTASHGRDHPDSALMLHNLAALHALRGELDEAINLYGQSLAAMRASAGETNPQTLMSAANLARLHANASQLDQAVALLEPFVAAVRNPSLDPSHGGAGVLLVYGDALRMLNRFEPAEQSLLEAHAMFERVLGSAHPAATRCAGLIADLYEAMERLDEAAQWRGLASSK